MPGPVSRGGFAGWVAPAVAAALIGLAGRAAAQVPTVPPVDVPPFLAPVRTTGPGSASWPGTTTQTNPLHAPGVPAQGPPPPAVPLLESTPSPFPHAPPAPVYPLPGSTEDNVDQEIAARKQFQECGPSGTRYSLFPSTLLWNPALASLNEPRFQVLVSSLDNYSNGNTLETSIGNTIGVFRGEPVGRDFAYQVDIFGVVHTRLTPDDLALADYRFGIPVSWKYGAYTGKLGYEHTSAHLGDEEIRALDITNISGYRRDEFVIAAGRYFEDQFRVYGQAAYAFNRSIPQPLYPLPQLPKPSPWRFDIGGEWAALYPTGAYGKPFAAVNVQFRGDEGYNPNFNAQIGWMFHNPLQRLASCRIFLDYYNGHSIYGYTYTTREKFYALGFSCDY